MSLSRSASFSLLAPQWWRWFLVGLICLGLAGIWWRLGQPADLVFDEHYHVPAARAVLRGDWRIFDWWQPPVTDGIYADWLHPPLFKYLQATSIKFFGDEPWAWRLPSAVAATGVIGLTFGLGWQLTHRRELGLLVAALMAMSGLGLVQARTGMNDMVLTFFGLAAVVAYSQIKVSHVTSNQRGWLLLAGVLAGLAAATKWTGFLLVGGLGGLELWRQRLVWQRWPWLVISLGLVPVIIYLIAFWPIWTTSRGWQHFVKLHQAIWQYQITRDHDQLHQSPAWQWPLNWRPVQYWQGEVNSHSQSASAQTAAIFAMENPGLNLVLLTGVSWWLVQIYRAGKKQQKFPATTWLWWLYLVWWLPLLLSPRILFQYHYLPALPLAAVLTILAFESFWRRLTLAGWILVSTVAGGIGLVWILFYPHWIGLPVPLWLAQTVYWLLPSWR